ncbi:hypothetical protein PTSG_05536 [Salpingoeca rosetta]|uniref:Peripheral subunit-binding (PSBD) domain-containing protein n=1 Tax=Salpingoeca rosetta (strain ATCC 50818 / BSB-021) TaxID=946362 RepID=F2UBH6_SALR5|nr:uncharacterized protein PTSG_05536 [Salpingoeca rosetta]EGD73842.1 hypothetical protein PTSG_05536 [Salpingoeca rosetta]|eukprot:XP_004993405.1 hypothetical protein PTSG_05536 [Salpingoeca rosetta]
MRASGAALMVMRAAAASLSGDVAAATQQKTLLPAVKQLVLKHGIDPSAITPSGPRGHILKGDVLAYLDGTQAQQTVSKAAPQKKAKSKTKGPQLTLSFQADTTGSLTSKRKPRRFPSTVSHPAEQAATESPVLDEAILSYVSRRIPRRTAQ